ncbi:MAG: hypothetical protein K8J31_12490 [Anaerolineae bacterium]|nr:hypothetical protein [Anaerolineae bacterium]
MKTPVILCFSLAFLLISGAASTGNSQENAVSDVDTLAYSAFDYDDGTTLYLYDAGRDENKMLYQSKDRLHFVFGSQGRIAFSTEWTWENNGKLFVMDPTDPDQPLVNLSRELDITGYPLGWSGDGSYLAFASVVNGGPQQAIYIWDGITAIDITPQHTPGNPQGFDVAWSPDGRLAFTVWFGYSNLDPRSEIYIWDGQVTFNLSQSADAVDRDPAWNGRGELAFGSTQENEYILLLWDGTSYVDGSPDVSSFTRIASQLHIYSSYSTWVNDELLAFAAYAPQDTHVQIYVWDRQTLTDMSQNPDSHNGGSGWSQDGYWAFVTFFSNQQRLYVRDAQNSTVFEARGQYIPAWSSEGSLIFCSRNDPSRWNLLRWDHASVSILAEGDEIFAQWRSGQMTVCSNG